MLALLTLLACQSHAEAPLTLDAPTTLASADGITVTVTPWRRGTASGRLILAEVSPAAVLSVLPAATPAPLADLLGDGPLVAVNGGFYDQGQPMGLVRAGSTEHAPLQASGGSGVFVIDGPRRRVVHRSDAAGIASGPDALQSIDRLVDAGAVLVSEGASPALDARTAVAVQADGDVLMGILFAEAAVASEADGQIRLDADSSSSGVSLREWATILSNHGAVAALNLDGGYSTSMSVRLPGARLDVHPHRATINALVATPAP